jgi:predicted enzyme related to lactoylglutathione lyase
MKRVTGLGGVFFKSQDKTALTKWYSDRLGLDADEYGKMFQWRDDENPESRGYTVWSPFKEDTKYFEPSSKPFMINFRVDDLAGLLAALRQEGVQVVGEIQDEENGRFGWIMDPEGNKIELWEPVDCEKDPYLPE